MIDVREEHSKFAMLACERADLHVDQPMKRIEWKLEWLKAVAADTGFVKR